MNDYINLFKTDFFNGLIALSKKTWLKITYTYSIYYVATLIIGGIFAVISLLGVVDVDLFNDLLGNPDSQHSLLLFQQISDMILTPEFIISFLIVFIILMILASWNYYFAFITSNAEIKGEERSFGELLKMSINTEVLKLVGVFFVLIVIIDIMVLAAVFSASFSIPLAILMFLIVLVVCMRFMLVLPAYVIGNYDLSSAFAFSFHHVTWARAFKFFGICILAFLAIMGISIIIGLIGIAISLIPFIGPLIQIAINVFFGAIIMAITVAGLTGLFYRYANESSDNTVEIPLEE